jgi:uncharacterized protein (TIGR02246 family)
MKTPLYSLLFITFVFIAFACQPQPSALTDAQKGVIADSAKAVAQQVAGGIQALDGAAVMARFSSDPDARFLENGFLYASYSAFKDSLVADFATLSTVSYQIDASNVVVLGADAAVITESFHFSVKPKTDEEVKGQGIASLVVQMRNGRWQIIQWHESELSPSDTEETMSSPTAKEGPAKK